MSFVEFIKTSFSTKPTTINCSCQRTEAWYMYLEHLNAHECTFPCQDVTCTELRANYEKCVDHPALYFSLKPFVEDAPDVYWAVFGESRSKRRLWILCAICAKNVEIDMQKAVYYENGYEAVMKKHPKGSVYTVYLPKTF